MYNQGGFRFKGQQQGGFINLQQQPGFVQPVQSGGFINLAQQPNTMGMGLNMQVGMGGMGGGMGGMGGGMGGMGGGMGGMGGGMGGMGGGWQGFNRWANSNINYQTMEGYTNVDYSNGWSANIHDQLLRNNVDFVFQHFDMNCTGQL